MIRGKNAGGGVAGNVALRHTLPEGLLFRSFQISRGWDCQPPDRRTDRALLCTAQSLEPGEEVILEVEVVVEALTGVVRTEASIVSNALDRHPDDNRVVTANPVVPARDASDRP